MNKRKKSPDRVLYDITDFGNPFFYTKESTNLPEETLNWLRDNKVYEIIIQERGGCTHYTLLVSEEDYNLLQENDVDYLLILTYGNWAFITDDNIKILNPVTNKRIKSVKLFGGS